MLRWHFPRFFNLAFQILNLNGDAKAGIGFDPNSRIHPIIAGIDGGDISKPTVTCLVGHAAFERFDRKFVMLPADRLFVVTGRRDLEDQRFPSSAGRRVEFLNNFRVRMLMHFVDRREMHVETVHFRGISRKWPKPAGSRQHRQIIDGARKPRREWRAGVNHAFGFAENNSCLVARSCSRIDMAAKFTIGDQRVKRGSGQHD